LVYLLIAVFKKEQSNATGFPFLVRRLSPGVAKTRSPVGRFSLLSPVLAFALLIDIIYLSTTTPTLL
jgi:hypothetical protein